MRIGQQVSSPTQYFWYRTTLMISKDINTPEVFNWKIALALGIAWILVYMCMIKGITSSGKVRQPFLITNIKYCHINFVYLLHQIVILS